ncbi:MAG: ribosome small subunit-dependent GTPase A, partial [Candidatus Latescibacteria bacterium]|nr:ribosome small subunit-dependent GTPase A [Candidatus Latescibacterota bacterium]
MIQSHTGIVIREHLGHYVVKVPEGYIIDCTISSKLRKSLIYPEADPSSRRRRVIAVRGIKTIVPVSIGDDVRFDYTDGKTGVIREVLPRRSKLSRRAAGQKHLEQIIIANVNQVLPVFAVAAPEPNLRMLDRFIAIAEVEGIETVICMNKIDLDPEYRIRETMSLYERIGYRVIFTSALRGEGIEEFLECLRGKISVLTGSSGVGKTSLLNAIQPGLGLRVRELSERTGKGRHTTAHLELIELDDGGM